MNGGRERARARTKRHGVTGERAASAADERDRVRVWWILLTVERTGRRCTVLPHGPVRRIIFKKRSSSFAMTGRPRPPRRGFDHAAKSIANNKKKNSVRNGFDFARHHRIVVPAIMSPPPPPPVEDAPFFSFAILLHF